MSLLRKGGSWLKNHTIDAFETPFARVGFTNYSFAGTYWRNAAISSGATQGNWITYAPRDFAAGTWALVLQFHAEADAGIFTVAVSTDNVNWTTIATIDGYAATNAAVRAEVTGIPLAAGTYYLRITMANKNASSTSYYGLISAINMVKTA